MERPILNAADAPASSERHGQFFGFEMRELSLPLGGRAIGANLTRVPPGRAAFPFHHHRANEEHFFVLSGSGTLRVGSRRYAVQAHDYIVHLPGGPEQAHQLINTGRDDLVYLAISTQRLPEVVGYPDSGKTGVRVASGDEPGDRVLLDAAATETGLGYWDAEDGREVAAALAADTRE